MPHETSSTCRDVLCPLAHVCGVDFNVVVCLCAVCSMLIHATFARLSFALMSWHLFRGRCLRMGLSALYCTYMDVASFGEYALMYVCTCGGAVWVMNCVLVDSVRARV